MNTHKNNIINDPFEGRPTRFGKAVVEVAKNEGNQLYWDELYNIFLNTPFWLPMLIKNKGTKKEAYYPVLSVHKNGKQNLVLFEKKSRAADWHKNNKKKVEGDVYVAKYGSGYDAIKSLQASLLKQYDLYIDFGKSTFLIFDPDRTLWLRKMAIKIDE